MIIVDLDKLGISYKIIPPGSMERSLENHCSKTNCEECKYNLLPYENCELIYTVRHNLMQTDEKYITISDEEGRFICNQDVYCHGRLCKECRYDRLIYDKDGKTIDCAMARIIAHRIIRGTITRDQYEIRNGGENI